MNNFNTIRKHVTELDYWTLYGAEMSHVFVSVYSTFVMLERIGANSFNVKGRLVNYFTDRESEIPISTQKIHDSEANVFVKHLYTIHQRDVFISSRYRIFKVDSSVTVEKL